MKKNDGSFGYILLIIIMVVLMCVSFVGIFLMIKETGELREEVKKLKEDDKEDTKNEDSSTKCKSIVGAYYAEVIDDNLHMRQTYSFSADGSYITYVENGGATNGTYTLNEGVINFKQKPEVGPETEIIEYSYSVSDDCKTIYVNEENLKYELKLIAE